MEIEHRILVNRQISANDIIDSIALFYMEDTDVANDENLTSETILENETIYLLQNIDLPSNVIEKYCYVKTRTIIGQDGNTKVTLVEKIIIDSNLIEINLLKLLFKLLLQPMINKYPNRIVGGIMNRLVSPIDNCAEQLAEYTFNLFNEYTSATIKYYFVCNNFPFD